MKSLKIISTLMAAAVLMCSCGKEEVSKWDSIKTNPFDFQSNTVNPEIVVDGVADDEIWKSDNLVTIDFATSNVSIVRRPDAIYMYFKVRDITQYRYVAEGNADEVTVSDSIEFYFDTKLGRADSPQTNCYQINLGRDSRTRILSGSGGVWTPWMAMYTFEVREGIDDEEEYYFVEAMIPVAQMNIGATESIGLAFGQVDRFVDANNDLPDYFTWTGLTYQGTFVDPQIPSTYLVLTPDGNQIYTYSEYLALQEG